MNFSRIARGRIWCRLRSNYPIATTRFTRIASLRRKQRSAIESIQKNDKMFQVPLHSPCAPSLTIIRKCKHPSMYTQLSTSINLHWMCTPATSPLSSDFRNVKQISVPNAPLKPPESNTCLHNLWWNTIFESNWNWATGLNLSVRLIVKLELINLKNVKECKCRDCKCRMKFTRIARGRIRCRLRSKYPIAATHSKSRSKLAAQRPTCCR